MERPSTIPLYESHLKDLAREAEMARLEAQLPRRPVPWRAILITAVALIGMAAWLLH
jgi:hypothetical protein